MNRIELVKAVAAKTEMPVKDVAALVAAVEAEITATVASGEPVALSGFAKFVKVERPARMGRNPATGQAIKIAASKKARITPLKAFKDAVMAGKVPAAKKAAAKKAAPAKKAPAKKAPAKKR